MATQDSQDSQDSRECIAAMVEERPGRRRFLPQSERGRHSQIDWEMLLLAWQWSCACCGATDVPLEKDHIRPLSRGGRDTIDNIQPLCGPCNKRKGVRVIRYGGRSHHDE